MGDLPAAAGWLRRMPPADRAEIQRVRCRAELLRAELRQAHGDGLDTLAGLPAEDDPGMNAELHFPLSGHPCARYRQRLAASLADWPAAQRCFLATWR